MTILDTNVVSEFNAAFTQSEGRSGGLTGSLDRPCGQQPSRSSRFDWGLQIMPNSKRRDLLSQRFDEVLARMNEQIAPFDTEAAQQAAFFERHRERCRAVLEICVTP